MKILHVFNVFYPLAGGTVDLMSKLTRTLAQRGHEVAIYTSDFRLDQVYIDSLDGIKVCPFHSWLNLLGSHLTPSMVAETKRSLKDFDIIHLHGHRCLQNIPIHHYAQKYGIPYVVDAHGSTPRLGKRLLKRLFDIAFGYRILRDATYCIGETQMGVNEYKEFGVDQDKIILIPPPFFIEEFSQLPAAGGFRSRYGIGEKRLVMFVGRINQIKGLDFLVESFAELAKLRSDVILAIVGNDDGYKPTLDALIGRLGLSSKVLFTGFLSGEEKLSALVDADVFIQVSRYEQGAWAPIEAVLCGTPIIVTGHTGTGEDVKRLDAGYLVEFGNTEELAGLIMKILEDPGEAEGKARVAAKYVRENMSMAERIVDYEKLYAKCIKEANNG